MIFFELINLKKKRIKKSFDKDKKYFIYIIVKK